MRSPCGVCAHSASDLRGVRVALLRAIIELVAKIVCLSYTPPHIELHSVSTASCRVRPVVSSCAVSTTKLSCDVSSHERHGHSLA